MDKKRKFRNHGVPKGNNHQNINKNMDETAKINNPEEAVASPADNVEEVAPEEVETLDNFDAVESGEENEPSLEEQQAKEIEDLKAKLEKEKKEYLFLMAEFDNFRKRTLKEKSEIIKNAGENVFKGLLPIVDDMERGIKASESATDVESVREGLVLIYNKLIKYMEQNGVKQYADGDDTFDADRHEAITAIPVQDEAQKGKILDTIEKGYTINDKVLRHAKVVVGQ